MRGGAIPVVETERLLLRAQREDDLTRHAAMMTDPAVTRYLGGTAIPRDDAWRRLIACAGLWTVLGYGYWSVERKADGAYIGLMGFADFKRDMTPCIDGLPEMGWLFCSEAHGQGYAGEAVAAGLQWADKALAGQTIMAIINPLNLPSIRVAEKAGFSQREDAVFKGEPILLFRRPPAA